MKWAIRVLLALGVALLPIYSSESGQIQPAHAILALSVLLIFAGEKINLEVADLLALGLLATVVTREALALTWGGGIDQLLPATYMLFSVGLFIALKAVARDRYCEKSFAAGLIGALMVATAGVVMFGYGLRADGETGRAVGTFNNPNQLGYFAVLTLSLFVLMHWRGAVGRSALIIALCICGFLAAASLSKAALLSVGFATALVGFAFGSGYSRVLGGCLILLLLAGAVYMASGAPWLDDYAVVQRLQTIGGQADDSLEGRGYSALAHADGTEILFGLGASGAAAVVGHEIHSTVFGVLGCYGLVGAAWFVGLLALWIARTFREFGWIGLGLVCAPAMAYGVTHNGTRFSLFWILLAMSFAVKRTASYSNSGRQDI
jgi:hypothetical protein